MGKAKVSSRVRVNAYNVIERAVDDGVQYGVSRRCIDKLGLLKCSEEQEQQAINVITEAVMTSLCEWLEF